MLIEKQFSNVDREEERVFSVLMSEEELRLYSEFLEEREYGAKSKILGAISPGAWQAKEAAKYGYEDEDDYKDDRLNYALKGIFAPITSTVIRKKAQKMAEEGKSPAEIRKYLEHNTGKRIAGGVLEALTQSAWGLGHVSATMDGLVTVLNDDRNKKRKKFKKHEDDD